MKKHLLSLIAITMMIATTTQAQIPTNGLIAWYPFTGNAVDSSGNGNNGIVNGATLTTDRFGNPNSAYSFNGSGQYISVPNSSSLTPTQITINSWVKALPQNSDMAILSKMNHTDASNYSYGFQIQSKPNDFLKTGWSYLGCTSGGLGTGFIGTNKISNDIWTMVTTSITNTGACKNYINGRLVDSFISKNNPFAPCGSANSELRIGEWWQNDPQWYNGQLDDIRIYNRPLDSTEVKALYHEGGYASIPTNGLIAWYPFTGNALDSSGNGNNGTVNSATLTTDRFGNTNSAYSFTNANGGISVPSFKALDSHYTISYWAYYSSSVINTSIRDLSQDWQNNGFFVMYRDLPNNLSYGTPGTNGASNNTSIESPSPLDLNKWYYITAIRNGSNLKLLINGKLQITGNNTVFGNIVAKSLFIGGDPNQVKQAPNAAFNGKLDDIRIYNRPLGSTEVEALYHEGGYNGSSLPVSLLGFAANKSGSAVQLQWQTANELNIAHFIIERSSNGNSFSAMGTLTAKGSGANSYSFTDKAPLSGTNYYRLQSIDKDGVISYSKVVNVEFVNSVNRFTVYPNPVATILTIKGEHIASVQILNNMGRIVSVQSLHDATNPLLSVRNLATGVYHVRIQTTDNKTSTIEFVKQ